MALLASLLGGMAAGAGVLPDPAADRAALRAAYQQRFPDLALDDYSLGVYAIDAGLRAQWEELNEFPPYEFAIDEGKLLFEHALPVSYTHLTLPTNREV